MNISSMITDLKNWLNENQGVLSAIIFVLTVVLAWLSGFFKWMKDNVSKSKKARKMICAWKLFPDKENNEFFEYKFAPRFQNKTDEIIKEFWINFASSGFEFAVNQTEQTILFDGWSVGNEALQLMSRNDYKFAPQNFIEPFEITIKLRKELPRHDAWVYISYGVPDAKKIELNYRIKYKKLKKFIEGQDHSGQKFLEHMGMANNNVWNKKITGNY